MGDGRTSLGAHGDVMGDLVVLQSHQPHDAIRPAHSQKLPWNGLSSAAESIREEKKEIAAGKGHLIPRRGADEPSGFHVTATASGTFLPGSPT